jgi:hypothetical protein
MTTKKRKAAKKSKSAKSAGGAKTPPTRTERSALSVATSSRRGVSERVAAMYESPLASSDKEENLQPVLKVLRNKEEPVPVRLAALQTLQAASFGSIAFESLRGDYIAALREVAQDTDSELRQRALGILAREKDGFAQKKLLQGLENPEKALVPPEKALQLLSYDVHSDAYPLAREIVNNPPNTAAKREALRLLAADASSAPLFEKVMRDKNESSEIRQVSAAALQSLRPGKMQDYAREALLDPAESDEIQTMSLTALTNFGDAEAIGKDEKLRKQVTKLSDKASTKVKQGARSFLKKYNDE